MKNNLQINVLNIALSSQQKLTDFHIKNFGNSGISSLSPWKNVEYENTISLVTQTGESLVNSHQLPAPTLIKIDVEGHELEVLMGFGQLLMNNELRSIIFEAADEDTRRRIESFIGPYGFDVMPIVSGTEAEVTNYHASRRNR